MRSAADFLRRSAKNNQFNENNKITNLIDHFSIHV